jgi:hypothetical protein
MILHAMDKWPEGMDAALWPYAMRLTCDIDNCTHQQRRHITPLGGFQMCKYTQKSGITTLLDARITVTQPHLIDSILNNF